MNTPEKKSVRLLINHHVMDALLELYNKEGRNSLSVFIEEILITYLNDRGVII